ncbi:ferredoxin reductase-like protein [Pluteus cervinus]|uniref:Ferredoxin reductase-like protein n=1 Tax=Pluteus cervinus TaxID=181527 RepID=A0ACD3BDD0_9AGAR|nr:ferredoxin reductase-like protein [Pluteus cervinus]
MSLLRLNSRFPVCRHWLRVKSPGTAHTRWYSTLRPRFSRLPLLGAVTVLTTGACLYFFLPDASRSAPTFDDQPLSPTHFTCARLVSSEACGEGFKLLELAIPPRLLPPSDSAFPPIWSVFIKDDDIQVERPYTPLAGISDTGRMQFWIKKYPDGEVGRWLHSKACGDQIELRGPLITWRWKDDEWDDVVMVSGGTGITPFIQLFHSIISQECKSQKTRFTLLHSSPRVSELPPPQILGPLRQFSQDHPCRFRVSVHVDSLPDARHAASSIKVGRIGKKDIEHALSDNDSRPWWKQWFTAAPPNIDNRKILFLVCGPNPMVTAIAGPYGRNLSQGQIGGILKELGATKEHVWKL